MNAPWDLLLKLKWSWNVSYYSTLIHPDATVIPEVSNILKDDFVHNKDHYEQPVCDLAKPKFFELEVIDELSVSFF